MEKSYNEKRKICKATSDIRTEKQAKDRLKKLYKMAAALTVLTLILISAPICLYAEGALDVNINGNGMETLEIIIMLSLITLIPSILMLMTCFTRIIIVLSFLRNALGIQQAPPNQVLIGIALFLTLFIMAPVFSEINQNAYTPYKEEKITQEQFLKEASVSMKKFMIKQAKKEDINLFIDLSKTEIKTVGENGQKLTNNEILMELPMTTIIPAFVTSELKRAFTMGFFIFLPFLLIDMVVSSVLMSMGMVMLPPAMISLPFKLLLFVLVDGWGLLMQTLVKSFIQ